MLNLPQDTELDAFAAALVDDKDALLEPYDSDEARQRVTSHSSLCQLPKCCFNSPASWRWMT